MAVSKDFVIEQGRTFTQLIYWADEDKIVYKPITAVTQTAPVRLTVTGHSLTNGWPVAVTNVKGMTQLNAEANAVKDKDYTPVTIVDLNTIELNAINAAGFKTYTSGGYIQYFQPVDLTGYTARMSIKGKVGGTELLSLTPANSRITVDAVSKAIALTISAADTTTITWSKGVYDLEMVSPSNVVTAILTGKVTVTKEVTT